MEYIALAISDVDALSKTKASKYKIELVNWLLEWANIDIEDKNARRALLDGKKYTKNGFYLRIMKPLTPARITMPTPILMPERDDFSEK